MDSQSRISDVAGIAALVQCLVRRHADTRRVRTAEPEALAESRFRAARDGVSAYLVDGPRACRPLRWLMRASSLPVSIA